jgi:hypothetical protein
MKSISCDHIQSSTSGLCANATVSAVFGLFCTVTPFNDEKIILSPIALAEKKNACKVFINDFPLHYPEIFITK